MSWWDVTKMILRGGIWGATGVCVVPAPPPYKKEKKMDSRLLTINVHKDIPAGTIIPCDDPESALGSYSTPSLDQAIKSQRAEMEKQQKVLNELVEKLKNIEPPPDLSIKPEDIVGYCFGYVCPKKHVNATFENITVDGYKERRACQTCGRISKPAIVKRTSEAQWGNTARAHVYNPNPESKWSWYNSNDDYFGLTLNWGKTIWTKHEFVHFLDNPVKTKARKK